MSIFILILLIFQVSCFPTRLDVFLSKGIDTIFFENIQFKGKKFIFLNRRYLRMRLKKFSCTGKSLVVPVKTNKCQNLPTEWQNRASSILTNRCIVLFTSLSCKLGRSTQVFTSGGYFDKIFSKPAYVPNNNFYNTM